jgi:hypothetical protein
VSQNILLTAGHNVTGLRGTVAEILITHPGMKAVDPAQVSLRNVPTISCKIVGSLYKQNGSFSTDIAILHSGSFNSPYFLRLSKTVLPADAIVDVIGYPDEMERVWLETHDGIEYHRAREEVELLLPKGHLLATRGASSRPVGAAIPYHLTTCPGLGGGCVLYKGDVVGKRRSLIYTDTIGVHIGHYDKNFEHLPMGLTFTSEEVSRFLQKHGLNLA